MSNPSDRCAYRYSFGVCDAERSRHGVARWSHAFVEPAQQAESALSTAVMPGAHGSPLPSDTDAAVRAIAERIWQAATKSDRHDEFWEALKDAARDGIAAGRAIGRDDVMNEITKERDQWAGVNAIGYNMLDDLRRTIIARRAKGTK